MKEKEMKVNSCQEVVKLEEENSRSSAKEKFIQNHSKIGLYDRKG
jgi:hypothetical protein